MGWQNQNTTRTIEGTACDLLVRFSFVAFWLAVQALLLIPRASVLQVGRCNIALVANIPLSVWESLDTLESLGQPRSGSAAGELGNKVSQSESNFEKPVVLCRTAMAARLATILTTRGSRFGG